MMTPGARELLKVMKMLESKAAGVEQRDMPDVEFRKHAARVTDWVARYLEHPERWRVLPDVQPGELRAALPPHAPEDAEPFDRILDDFERLIPGATTHWNHPGFFAYFSISGSAAGILGELLASALNVNAMLWRSGPAATELEEHSLNWLREMMGLPEQFDGTINDTASASTLYALAAAREACGLDVRERGLSGRADVPALRVYCSEETHSSVDKAAITLGIGMQGVRHIGTDKDLAMNAVALRAAIEEDRARGIRPIAVVATIGTTSTTAIDPVAAIADICEEFGLWLHVDAAYGGSAAVLPEQRDRFRGWERADSIVVNPHKWLFVPLDCSVLYTSRPDMLKRAFSLTPEYLITSEGNVARNLMDYGVSLGRRFRALKLWFVLRSFGVNGIRSVLREHLRLAQAFAEWIDADAAFERLAPTPLSVVVFRWHPAGVTDEEQLERTNAALLDYINATGDAFLSHTRVGGKYALRLAIGNLRTQERHVRRVFEIAREFAAGQPA